MANLQFVNSVYFVEPGKMLIYVSKTGLEAVKAKVSFIGASNRNKDRYKDRALKSSEGLFYSSTKELVWGLEEEGIKSVEVDVFKQPLDFPKYFYCSLRGYGDNVVLGLNKTHCFILPNGYDERKIYARHYIEPGIAREGDMELKFTDNKGRDYPQELHPVLVPETNKITYWELGDFVVANARLYIPRIEQYTQTHLDNYNSENGTNFTNKTKEYILMPFECGDYDVPLQFVSKNLWTKNDGSTIDWLHPISATMKANTNIVEIEYKSGRWATPFNEKQEFTWSVDLMMSMFINKSQF